MNVASLNTSSLVQTSRLYLDKFDDTHFALREFSIKISATKWVILLKIMTSFDFDVSTFLNLNFSFLGNSGPFTESMNFKRRLFCATEPF